MKRVALQFSVTKGLSGLCAPNTRKKANKMIRNVALILGSLSVLAACASTPEREGEKDIAPVAESTSAVETPSIGSANPLADPDPDEYSGRVDGGSDIINLRDGMIDQAGDTVNFAFDSSALSSQARRTLKQIAIYIQTNDEVNNIVVEGHADERGTREYNLALGDRRAVSVKKYLVGLGLDPKRITTISYGKERPLDPAHTEAAWAKNRRAVVVIN